MGEIRSTLDIIMEKTKGILVTEEEKQQMKLKELEESISGLFRKYENNVISEEDLISNLKVMIEKDKDHALKFIKEKAVDLVKISASAILGMSLLKKLFPQISQYLDSIEQDNFDRLKTKEKEITKKELFQLKKQGITGDAIIINIDINPEWKQFIFSQETQLKEAILKAIDNWASGNNL